MGLGLQGVFRGGMGLSPNQSGHHIALASEVGTSSILANESSESFARIADRDTCFLFCDRSCHYQLHMECHMKSAQLREEGRSGAEDII